MASATLPAHMKPLSMSQYCFTATLSAPSLTHPSRHTRQHFHLYSSSSLPPWSCLRAKTSNMMVPLVAQTSDWARQDEEEEEKEEEEEEEGEEGEGSGSDWKAQGVMGEEGVDANQGQEGTPARFEDGAEPPEDAKLFVGNLPFDISSEKLAQLFEQAGIVEVSEVIYNRQTDQSRGFGFVTMNTVEEAEKAVEMFHQYDLNGRLLTVNKAAPRGTQTARSQSLEPSFRIYVGNLPWQIDNARLEQVFSEYGKVMSARVVYDRESGRSRGFGFVMMSSEAELNDAIAALDGQNLDGRAIRVSVAEERQRRSF